LSTSTIWGLDPGIRDVFVDADNDTSERHRVRKTSTNEYYQLAGFKKAMITRAKFGRTSPNERAIIAAAPTMKTSSIGRFITAATYIFNNFSNITNFYDLNLRFNKLKFQTYIKKQKALSEMAKRLITGSSKYRPPGYVIENSAKKWKQLAPHDKPEESTRPIIIAFGAAKFGKLRGNVTAPTKVFKESLARYVKERNKRVPTYIVMVDEFLTSQICPRCNTRTTENEKNEYGSKAHPVLKCKTCDTRWNRDHMASTNIRSIFLHMAMNNNNRPDNFNRG
jgi:hypothetical protein